MKRKLKFKIDENLPPYFALRLAAEGYDACSAEDQRLNGQVDTLIAKACIAERRVLITQDLGFADIRVYPPGAFFGIVILRAKTQDHVTYGRLLESIIAKFDSTPLHGRLWVVDENAIRVRSSDGRDN